MSWKEKLDIIERSNSRGWLGIAQPWGKLLFRNCRVSLSFTEYKPKATRVHAWQIAPTEIKEAAEKENGFFSALRICYYILHIRLKQGKVCPFNGYYKQFSGIHADLIRNLFFVSHLMKRFCTIENRRRVWILPMDFQAFI